MAGNADDLIDRILAENEKINQLATIVSAVKNELRDGDNQLGIALEKLDHDDYDEALPYSLGAIDHYSIAVSVAGNATQNENSSPEIKELLDQAATLLLTATANLARAKQVQFWIEDLRGLQLDVQSEVSIENWPLVALYAYDAVRCYPKNKWFGRYAELAANKTSSRKSSKAFWLSFLLGREE